MSEAKKDEKKEAAPKSVKAVKPTAPEPEHTEGAYVRQSLRRKPGGMTGKGR